MADVHETPNPTLLRLTKLLNNAAVDLVLAQPINSTAYVVLLRRIAGETTYAACRLSATSEVATAPNYFDESLHHLVLAAPISADGLQELVPWTDHGTALRRFGDIARRTGISPERLRAVYG